MDERRLEIKVGALLLAAVGGLLALLWLMGELTLGGGTTLIVEFGHTGNVVRNAPVKLGGVPIGRVEKVVLTPDRRDEYGEPVPVRMELSVDEKVLTALREDALVTVATQGPLGEPYLEVYTGSARAGPFPPEKVIRGVDAPRLDLVYNRLSNFLESASRVLEEDPRALSTLVGGVLSLTKTVDGVLTENRQDIHTLASELSAAARDLRLLSEAARSTLEPGGRGARLIEDAAQSASLMRSELPRITQEASRAIGGLAALSGGFNADDGEKLKIALDRYALAGERLERLADRGDRILARIEEGKGTMGGAYKDPQLYNDLKDLISDLRKHPWKLLWKD